MPLDWILGLIGGAMIGLAAAGFLLLNGRIMGASGIVGSLVAPAVPQDWPEKLLFIGGLMSAPLLYMAVAGPLDLTVTASPALLVLAGLLVGVGTRMGSGCTSGHGVCGLPRLAPRSIANVLAFMAAGLVTFTLASFL
jgi:hypothetical protein